MRRLLVLAAGICAVALGGPARADVLIGMAGPITGKEVWRGGTYVPLEQDTAKK